MDYNNLDMGVINLARAIRQKESSGGKNQTSKLAKEEGSFGGMQYTAPTFTAQAKLLGGKDLNGNPLDINNNDHQNLVFYTWAKKLKDAGYGVDQIAAAHNAGEGKLTSWQNHRGVNKFGNTYDTPAYVNEVLGYYNALKNGSQIPTVQQTPKDTYEVPPQPRVKVDTSVEDARAIQQAKEDTSAKGMLKNFGKALIGNIAGSEVGLGDTISKIATSGKQSAQAAKNIETITNQQIQLRKLIKEKEAKGQDATRLKVAYNDTVKQIGEQKGQLEEARNLPSTQKVAGQLGGTALDVLTAGTYGTAVKGLKAGKLATKTPLVKAGATAVVPELGQIATQKSSGLLTKKGAGNVLKGASIGYGYDVSQGLQGARGEERTGGKAFIPGLGTAIGGGIPAVAEGVQSIKNVRNPELRATNLSAKREKELSKLDKYVTLKKASEKGRERGIDIKKVLADTDVLHGSVDNTGTITTKGEGGAVEQYTKEFIDGNEKLVSDILKKENRAVSPVLIKTQLEKAVMDAGIEGAALTKAKKAIDDEIAGYMLRANASGLIPVEVLHNAKIDKYNNINFFTEGATKKYDKTIANALKKAVEENTSSADVKAVNQELSKHFAVIDYLNKLDNKKVEGGKLGKYFAQTVGAIVGGQVGGALGAIAGAEAGARLKGGAMSRVFTGKTGKKLPQAEAITKAKEYLSKEPLQLPAYSNRSGSLKTSQTPTITNTIKGISPTVLPKKEKVNKLSTGDISTQLPKLAAYAKKFNNEPELIHALQYNKPEDVLNEIKLYRKSGNPDITLDKFFNSGKKIMDSLRNEGGYISTGSNDLIKEAKKYKTAEEFVKKQIDLPTKTIFNNDTKGMWNNVKNIGDYKIARVNWDTNQWKIVNTDNFEEIAKDTYKPIKQFYTRDELYDYLKNESKSQLEQIWEEAQRTGGSTKINPLTTIAGATAVGAGAINVYNNRKKTLPKKK